MQIHLFILIYTPLFNGQQRQLTHLKNTHTVETKKIPTVHARIHFTKMNK